MSNEEAKKTEKRTCWSHKTKVERKEAGQLTNSIFSLPEVVFIAGMNMAGSSIRAGETDAGIDGYFTVLTLEERGGQGQAKE